ncbi:hypothetical protein M885DRAFT_505408 [Pelagophyceae sp. CCMP2097]|nr:hypothetical protein M885DRAFT_505408 [Pelagophyceae sp. CCMP2097]
MVTLLPAPATLGGAALPRLMMQKHLEVMTSASMGDVTENRARIFGAAAAADEGRKALAASMDTNARPLWPRRTSASMGAAEDAGDRPPWSARGTSASMDAGEGSAGARGAPVGRPPRWPARPISPATLRGMRHIDDIAGLDGVRDARKSFCETEIDEMLVDTDATTSDMGPPLDVLRRRAGGALGLDVARLSVCTDSSLGDWLSEEAAHARRSTSESARATVIPYEPTTPDLDVGRALEPPWPRPPRASFHSDLIK